MNQMNYEFAGMSFSGIWKLYNLFRSSICKDYARYLCSFLFFEITKHQVIGKRAPSDIDKRAPSFFQNFLI